MLDDQIIDLYFKRDESAITETSLKYGAYCNKIAFNILGDIFDSEECVNDAYHKTWTSVPPTRPKHLGAYVGRITRNVAIDRYNSRMAQKRGGHAYEESLDELCECIGSEDSVDISLMELGAVISNFLKSEKPINRKIFVRRYFYEDSIEDIAKIARLGVSYVKTSLFRTRQRLRLYLAKEGIYV